MLHVSLAACTPLNSVASASAGNVAFQPPLTTLAAPALWHGLHSSSSSGSSSCGISAAPAAAAGATEAAPEPAAGAEAREAAPSAQATPIVDLEAKLALLEGVGIGGTDAAQRYAPFLCSPTHHIAVRLAFLAARGKLRHPPRLWQVICPSDAELCKLHGQELAQLAAFKSSHLASQAWHAFCRQHNVQHAGPDPV
ncbi:hypothetical protein D9Q98_010222 [Chlorella vulgaris]|uniref:Uncharacterized protein n=1 Tax=Chlorella vulgaris TaxID=3077 RepID=A0A9D4TJX4_CHLVU|nr:hypothetical protein D9Q98_010222 [Chlorella vulgaris]